MGIDFGIIIAQIINFGILYFIFYKFLSKPLSKEIAERKEKLRKIANIDAEIEEKMEKANVEAEDILKNARKDSTEMISSSTLLAKKKADDIIAKAEDEAKAKLDLGLRKIEEERLSMVEGIKSKIVGLVLSLNKKLFDEEKTNVEFIEKEIRSIKM